MTGSSLGRLDFESAVEFLHKFSRINAQGLTYLDDFNDVEATSAILGFAAKSDRLTQLDGQSFLADALSDPGFSQ